MNTQLDSIQSIAGDDKLVFDFFANFSRFECALKRAGFVKSMGGSASPDWTTFANSLDGRLVAITEADFKSAKSLLLLKPPDKQMFVEPNSMCWEPNSRRNEQSEDEYLLRLVKDVRNNLFHGGKYPDRDGGHVKGQVLRNSELLQACLTILEKCRVLNDKVKRYFEEPGW